MGKIPDSTVSFEIGKKKMANETREQCTAVPRVSVQSVGGVRDAFTLAVFLSTLKCWRRGKNKQPIEIHESL